MGPNSIAQIPDSLYTGNCPSFWSPQAPTHAFLNVGNVQAKIFNDGFLFWHGSRSVYNVPKDEQASSELVVNLVIGGKIDSDTRVAGSSYAPPEYWPGPLNESGFASTDCGEFDRFWEVEESDIHFAAERNRELSSNIREWPAHLGAPFMDSDGDGEYNPELGDLPRLLGDQMIWWVMNDRAGPHQRYRSLPLGIEVRGAAYAYDSPGVLGNTTFYRYEITNRNDAPIDSFFVAWYRDFDLGYYGDDYVGSDTTLSLAYAYNGDNFDEGPQGFGESPPASGFTLLSSSSCLEDYSNEIERGPYSCWKDELSMHLTFVACCGLATEPGNALEWQNFLNGRLAKGSSLSESTYLNVNFSPPDSRFVFPGDPVTGEGISELNYDGQGHANSPSERRSAAGSRGSRLRSGETVVITFALLHSRGSSNLDSVVKLKAETALIRSLKDELVAPRFKISKTGPSYPFAASIAPNPASDQAIIHLSLSQSFDVSIQAFDLLGRKRQIIIDRRLPKGAHSVNIKVGDWTAGVYLIRFQLDHISETRLLVVR